MLTSLRRCQMRSRYSGSSPIRSGFNSASAAATACAPRYVLLPATPSTPSSVRTRTMTFARFMISRSANSIVTPASTTCTDTSVIFMACRTYHWRGTPRLVLLADVEVDLVRADTDQLPVPRVAALEPCLEVFLAPLPSEVFDGDRADELDP